MSPKLSKKSAEEALRQARITCQQSGWRHDPMAQLQKARDVAADNGLSIADMERVEFEADVVALGREQAERVYRDYLLHERYAKAATEIWRRRIRSRKDIRPLLSKAEKAGGTINPNHVRLDGVAMCGKVHLDPTIVTAIVRGLETALGWPHKV